MTDKLIERLNDEADQCRNDGADDIAKLLDEARAAIEKDRERQSVPASQDAANLLARYERQWHRMGELWERHQGKGWPAKEGAEFAQLRDERAPATRAALLAFLAAPQPQPVQPEGPMAETVEQAARDVAKCLNERDGQGLDLRHVAMLVHYAQQPVQEPVYQYQYANGSWCDQTKESHDYNVRHGQATVRVLYTSPQAAQTLSNVATQIKDEADVCMRKLEHAGLHRYQIDRLSGQVNGLIQAYEIAQAHGIPKGTT